MRLHRSGRQTWRDTLRSFIESKTTSIPTSETDTKNLWLQRLSNRKKLAWCHSLATRTKQAWLCLIVKEELSCRFLPFQCRQGQDSLKTSLSRMIGSWVQDLKELFPNLMKNRMNRHCMPVLSLLKMKPLQLLMELHHPKSHSLLRTQWRTWMVMNSRLRLKKQAIISLELRHLRNQQDWC